QVYVERTPVFLGRPRPAATTLARNDGVAGRGGRSASTRGHRDLECDGAPGPDHRGGTDRSPVGARTGDLQLAAVRPLPAGGGAGLLGAARPAAAGLAPRRVLPLLRRLGLALPRP